MAREGLAAGVNLLLKLEAKRRASSTPGHSYFGVLAMYSVAAVPLFHSLLLGSAAHIK